MKSAADNTTACGALSLADLAVMLSVPNVYKPTPDDEFRVYVIASALHRGTICRLRNPLRTMQVLSDRLAPTDAADD